MLKNGYQIVFKSGKDKSIYQIHAINNDMVELKSFTSDTIKSVHIDTIREAEDTEIMIGYRM